MTQVWGSAKALQHNLQNGTVIQPVLGTGGEGAVQEAERLMDETLQAEEARRWGPGACGREGQWAVGGFAPV
jgi:hypothetical protein